MMMTDVAGVHFPVKNALMCLECEEVFSGPADSCPSCTGSSLWGIARWKPYEGQTIIIPGEPVAQKRARARIMGDRAIIYDPKISRDWKATAQQHMIWALQDAGSICRMQRALFA